MATEAPIQIGKSTIWTIPQEPHFFYVAPMHIDADGAYKAYHRDSNVALDNLANAGKPGNWWALVTDNGERTGNPIVQCGDDPAPDYYVCMTALGDPTKAKTDPRRWVDSSTVPYFVLPGGLAPQMKVKLGDLGVALHRPSGKLSAAIYADVGPKGKIGEGSIALAKALGLRESAKNGGTERREIAWLVFPGSGSGKPRDRDVVINLGMELFKDWGGLDRFQELLSCEGDAVSFGGEEDLDPWEAGLERPLPDPAELPSPVTP